MSTACPKPAFHTKFQQRRHQRAAVALPAIVTLGAREYGARVLNLARGGAMIECSACLPSEALFLLRCGSISAASLVVWQRGAQYGVNFRLPLTEGQLTEQLSRHHAIESRRLPNPRAKSSKDERQPLGTGDQLLGSAVSITSATILSAILASHQQVETCVVELESIIAGQLDDIPQFNATRLQLRQANRARTQIALDACRHLMALQPSQPDLRALQRMELDISQMISMHVQKWPVAALRGDWTGYCRATRKILQGVRELIAAEKKLLCPMF